MQAIVSSALSKAGKKVLHLDKNDFYGGDDHATYSFSQFIDMCNSRKCQSTRQEHSPEAVKDKPPLPDILAKLKSCGHEVDEVTQGIEWKSVDYTPDTCSMSEGIVMVDHSSNVPDKIDPSNVGITQIQRASQGSPACYGYLMEKDPSYSSSIAPPDQMTTPHPCFVGYIPHRNMTLARMAHSSRCFNIDSIPKLLLSAGKMVDMIIASGVGHYLEFKSVDTLYYLHQSAASSPALHRVPSSKADIFNSKMFSALEKRMLMKLMQTAVDIGRKQEGLPVETLNETELAQGRALLRPQNKDTHTAAQAVSHSPPDSPFRHYLQASSVTPSLVPFVTHGLSLEPAPDCTSSRALESLYRHINAAGRYGSTSFLMPIYGTSEFTQAFCRLSAVWGGVFVLRNTVDRLLITTPRTPQKEQEGCREGGGGEPTPSSSPVPPQESVVRAVRLRSGHSMGCDFVVCDDGAEGAWVWKGGSTGVDQDTSTKKWRLVQRHTFINRSIFPSDSPHSSDSEPMESTKGVLIIPPMCSGLDNTNAIYIVQLDSSAMVTPVGVLILYIMTYIDPTGCEDMDRARAANLMQATAALLHTLPGTSTSIGQDQGLQEIMYATFLHPPVPRLESSHEDWTKATRSRYPSNVIPCDSRRENLLYLHEAAVQAEAIFSYICPGVDMFADREEVGEGQADIGRYAADEDAELAGLDAILASSLCTAGAEAVGVEGGGREGEEGGASGEISVGSVVGEHATVSDDDSENVEGGGLNISDK